MNKTLIFYLFFADYHSGQFSKGYRLLSRIQKRIKRHHLNLELSPSECKDFRDSFLYNDLVEKFGNKV